MSFEKAMVEVVKIILLIMLLLGGIGILNHLESIDAKLNDMREIESETRDSNWIMACDDVSAIESPLTFLDCNK